MKILITGANGQLGRACQAEFADCELFLGETDNCDITSREVVGKVVTEFEPELIIHAAAMTNVKLAESEPELTYKINLDGTENVALAARKHNAKMVYISTDFVFDGKKSEPYVEDDAVNPLNVYGRSKLAGELVVRDLVGEHFILRTAWLYGDGNNFVKTILKQAENNPELSVVNDQKGTPTYAKDLAKMIRAVVENGEAGTYHATNEDEATWHDFATEIIRLSGKENNVVGISTEEAAQKFKDPTKRAKYSVLSKVKLEKIVTPRPWQEALAEYLKTL